MAEAAPGVPDMLLAEIVLAAHLAVIAFNVFGLVAVPLGAWCGWRFVRVRWWRWLHVFSMGVVGLQALAGRACFLTLLEDALAGRATRAPLIMRLINGLIYWSLPPWVFEVAYVALFFYALALLRLVPPGSQR